METNTLIVDELKSRAEYICEIIQEYKPSLSIPKQEFIIAGGCMIDQVNDIDIFPFADCPMLQLGGGLEGKIVSQTRNATTWSGHKYPIQLCNYRKQTLADLVNSFDFSHIQVGARISVIPRDAAGHIYFVEEVYYTPQWISARCFNNSEYTGSDYPLSSLIRMQKYLDRDKIQKRNKISTTIKILNDIVKRGFRDYPDFKDQLDAIDLGLLPEELKDIEKAELVELYENLLKGTK